MSAREAADGVVVELLVELAFDRARLEQRAERRLLCDARHVPRQQNGGNRYCSAHARQREETLLAESAIGAVPGERGEGKAGDAVDGIVPARDQRAEEDHEYGEAEKDGESGEELS